jgi:glycosyltransferase involved in cell wall biosynthesis
VTSHRPLSANGVHTLSAQLANALVGAGVGVEFWHFRRDRDEVRERVEDSGVAVVELPIRAVIGGSRSSLARYVPRLSKEWVAQNSQSVDALHFHSIFQPEAWFLARESEVPYCISPHGGYAMHSWRTKAKWPLWLAFERPLLSGARFVVAHSDGDEASVRRLMPSAKIHTFPQGVDRPSNEPADPPADGDWLFIGRFDIEKKGLDLLIHGYARARRHTNLPRLIIRGTDFRNGRRRLEGMVEQLGLSEEVIIGDEVFGAEKVSLLHRCKVFLHASRTEGLPMILLEALAAGRPLAVTPNTNIGEAVRRSGAGYVITEPSVEAVESALITMAVAPHEEVVARARAALMLAHSEYSWSRASERMVELYASLSA